MTRLAVTGAGGFIGSSICRAALEAGCDVVAIGPGELGPHPRLRHEPARICDASALAPLLGGVSALIHAAGHGTPVCVPSLSSPAAQNELGLAASVLDAAARAGVEKVVLISSGGTIYGDVAGPTPITEAQNVAPISPYGGVMAAIEQLGLAMARAGRFGCVAARLSNPYGPGQLGKRGQGLVGSMFDRLGRGDPVEIWGDGGTVRDYVYVEDAAQGLLQALSLPSLTVCHVASGVGVPTREVVAGVAAAAGVDPIVLIRQDRDPGVAWNVLSPALMLAQTGWRAAVPWHEGLARTAAWWRARASRG
jgi:UDP-glucose 4-epimerase